MPEVLSFLYVDFIVRIGDIVAVAAGFTVGEVGSPRVRKFARVIVNKTFKGARNGGLFDIYSGKGQLKVNNYFRFNLGG